MGVVNSAAHGVFQHDNLLSQIDSTGRGCSTQTSVSPPVNMSLSTPFSKNVA